MPSTRAIGVVFIFSKHKHWKNSKESALQMYVLIIQYKWEKDKNIQKEEM